MQLPLAPSVRTIVTGGTRVSASMWAKPRSFVERAVGLPLEMSAGSRPNLSKGLIYSGGGGENSVAIARAPLLRPGRGRGNPRG